MPINDTAAGESASADEMAGWFDHLQHCFDAAVSRQGEQAHDLTIARRSVRVRFAGGRLTDLLRPLSHLLNSERPPAVSQSPLDICVFDSGTCGVVPGSPPPCFRQLNHRGEIHGLGDGDYAVNLTSDHHLLSLLHRPTGRAIYWIPNADNLPYWETSAPFRVLLSWWAATFGGQLTHAAAVGAGGRGALLVGRGGSGKSTTSLVAVEEGLEIVGDDYVLVTGEGPWVAHSVYHAAKLHTEFLRRSLPHWQARVVAEVGPERKSVVYLHECCPQQVRRELAIEAIVLPRVTSASRARLEPVAPLTAILAVAPSTMYQLPDARQHTLALFTRLAADKPAWALQLSADLSSGPRVLADWLTIQGVGCAA